MSASYTWRADRRTWLVTVHWHGQRERVKVDTEQTAKDLVRHVHKLELAGVNVVEALRRARTAEAAPVVPPAPVPRLQDALAAWIAHQVALGEIRHSSAKAYLGRCRLWLFAHQLPDGRTLGELPVDAVTREQIGAVLLAVREAGRSRAILNSLLSPLRRYYADRVEQKLLAVNPTADLKRYIGRFQRRGATRPTHFTEAEVSRLLEAAATVCPRWRPFIMTGCFAGLRWGRAPRSAGAMSTSAGTISTSSAPSATGAESPP